MVSRVQGSNGNAFASTVSEVIWLQIITQVTQGFRIENDKMNFGL
jgi:hypothetical protein